MQKFSSQARPELLEEVRPTYVRDAAWNQIDSRGASGEVVILREGPS